MTELYHYSTIEKEAVAEYKDRGSKFLALAFPINNVDDFKTRLAQVKAAHPKATHHCFAYRLGTDGNHFRVSDDGEPSGSAGRPVLGQIDSKELTNILVVVVRYFGGTLLGVPGLIQAYKSAAAMVLQLTPITQKPVIVWYSLQFDYARLNDVMTLLKQYQCSIARQEMQLFCTMEAGIPKADLAACLERLGEMHTVDIKKLAT
jgi:uncharacterized YigZ family protein